MTEHNIIYKQNNAYNAVIEIPKNTLAKMELSKQEKFHPIKQDTRINKYYNKEELRNYA